MLAVSGRCLPRPEDRAAHADMGCPERNRRFVIRTHAHAQPGNIVAPGDRCQQAEMERGIFLGRRNTHQSCNREAKIIAAGGNEGISVPRKYAGLLLFFARVDLDKQFECATLFRHLRSKRLGELYPVYRMNCVEQRDRVAHLVGLQRSDQMELCIRKGLFEVPPFLERLLNAIFTKYPVAGVKYRANGIRAKRLADRDKCHVLGSTTSITRRSINLCTDGLKPVMAMSVWRCAHGS